MTVKNDLQAVNKELKALTKKVEKMIVAVGKIEKPKPAKKAVKAKPAKKAVAKKKRQVTDTDTVLGIINRTKKGVGVAAIKNKTGFKDRKIYDIVKTLKKRGKVKSKKMGIYVKA